MTDSTTGGVLVPASTSSMDGQVLDDFLQAYIVAATGLPGASVLPRWQQEPPNLPSGDWCAYGVTSRESDTFAAEIDHSVGNGYVELRRHRILSILASFYGSNAASNAQELSDSVQIGQNHDYFSAQGMGVVDIGDIIPVPSLIKERWLYRADLTMRIKQQIVRTYSIDTLLASKVTLTTDVPPLSESVIAVVGQQLDSTFVLDYSMLA
jgi:hypothetical protein